MDLPPLTQARPRLSYSGRDVAGSAGLRDCGFGRYDVEINVNGQPGLVTTLLVQRAH
jgi:hypothetical protein